VSITDEQLQTVAEAAIADAIADLAHDRMGLSEMLEDELDGLSEDEQEAVMDRLEAIFREPQPTRRAMAEVLATMRGLEVAEKAGGRYLSALAYQGAAELLDAALNPPDEDEDDEGEDDGTCGDCADGRCHGGEPGQCGCARHDASQVDSDEDDA